MQLDRWHFSKGVRCVIVRAAYFIYCAFGVTKALSQLYHGVPVERETLLVARRSPLHSAEAKVSVPAAQSWALPVFELAAGAEPLHLQPVQEEGQAEGETSVPPGNELESLWGRDWGCGWEEGTFSTSKYVTSVLQEQPKHISVRMDTQLN